MALEFRLPDIGEGLTEADVLTWYVEVGGHVGLDEPLVELETAKAVVDMPAPRAGVVLHHGCPVGATISVGEILAVIGEADERWPTHPDSSNVPPRADQRPGDQDLGDQRPGDQDPADGSPVEAVEPADGRASDEPRPSLRRPSVGSGAPLVGTLVDAAEELPVRTVDSSPGPGEAQALPLVRKLAREAGVSLVDVVGTGPGGRITREDLNRHLDAVIPAAEGAGEIDIPSEAASVGDRNAERQRMSMVRRTIAEHMTRSWTEIPHVTTFDDVDATRLLEVRTALSRRHGRPVPIEALVGYACVRAIGDHPSFNATVDGDEIVSYVDVHLGVAVDTPEGLVAPVVHRANALSLLQLGDAISELAQRARDRSLGPTRSSGATFTVSNIGAVGGTHGTPIIPYGTSAILSVGRAVDRPVAVDGEVVVAPMLPLSLSYDHRIIDGAMGRRFLAAVMADLAEPALFLA